MADREHSNLPLGDEEIDLYQSWLVVRKSWKLIIVLFVVFVVGAVVYSRRLPRVYRVNTIVSLGHVETNGRETTLANLTDITQMIGSGSFLKKLIKSLNLDETKYGPEFENAIVLDAKENSQNILLRYDTADPPKAIEILNALIREIQNTYEPRAKSYRTSIDSQIDKLKEDIRTTEFLRSKMLVQVDRLKAKIEEERSLVKVREKTFLAQRNSMQEQIKNRQEQLKGLESIKVRQTKTIPELERNTKNLIAGKAQLTTQPSNEGMITTLLLSNNMQQNIHLVNLMYEQIKHCDLDISKTQDSIRDLDLRAATLLQTIEEAKIQSNSKISELEASIRETQLEAQESIPADIGKIRTEISQLESRKATIEGITVVTPPDYFAVSLETKQKALIGVSGMGALFLGVCLAFAHNWSQKNRNREKYKHS